MKAQITVRLELYDKPKGDNSSVYNYIYRIYKTQPC